MPHPRMQARGCCRAAVATLVGCAVRIAAYCTCLFQGEDLPAYLYTEYPSADPGKYKNFAAVHKYGTMCAAWDTVPGTPWQQYCTAKEDFSGQKANWCQVPWCYVTESCAERSKSEVFNGSNLSFSYAACGDAPNCFSATEKGDYGEGVDGCPYDPYEEEAYRVFKSDCACLYHGQTLPSALFETYPLEQPGKYANVSSINLYGTTCAAWDQSPDFPWQYSECPSDADWCLHEYNWCQAPWCYVDSSCPSGILTLVFDGSSATYYSYNTCLGTPDCLTNTAPDLRVNLPASCPFDYADTKWATAVHCGEGWRKRECTCIYQGGELSAGIYIDYPSSEPGKYQNFSAIAKYGTMCAAWDTVPGTPLNASCPANANSSAAEFNWCQVPWCYVGRNCDSKISSRVFSGARTFYSYAACGNAPNCYESGAYGYGIGCPYDPNSDQSYRIYKNDCECKYHGQTLPSRVYEDYPAANPGQYRNLTHIDLYGTTCAAWDQSPDTPRYSQCPVEANWCAYKYNWCQAPWCFVDASCASAIATTVFTGSDVFFSYDTCLGTPDCLSNSTEGSRRHLPLSCPFDASDSNWATADDCSTGWLEIDCSCMYLGSYLPADVYNNNPAVEPGKYKFLSSIANFGTMCAAWDTVPGTPNEAICRAEAADFSSREYNWCQAPWCYVGKSCDKKSVSTTFAGYGQMYYSYACGNASDCYRDGPSGKYGAGRQGCPYDPYGNEEYRIYKKENNCSCKYHGEFLPSAVYEDYPIEDPGKFKRYRNIKLYGTTCAAWDKMPDTPKYSECPSDANWCGYEYNWCQAPWCYVNASCASRIPTSVFEGSQELFFSYDTCLGTPDCFTNKETRDPTMLPPACPFDTSSNALSTEYTCDRGWEETECACIYNGSRLPADLYTYYPVSSPGIYKNYASIGLYGTMCAAWDSVPGTPLELHCNPNADFSTHWLNWCQVPWCYVGENCDKKIGTSIFQPKKLYYSYAACGNAPDCFNRGPLGIFGLGTPGCPYDPNGDESYSVSKVECRCKYQGATLPPNIYMNYPIDAPGKHKNTPNIEVYGTTCAAWDQSPHTPHYSSCPPGSDWCSLDYNWCQAPWCYVGASCRTSLASLVFLGSDGSYFSYDTCLSTPDCFSFTGEGLRHLLPAACPFDSRDTQWSTAGKCSSWTELVEVSSASLAATSPFTSVICAVAWALWSL